MIKYAEPGASIFDSGAQVLVNPVNCYGPMGKGLALQFARRFDRNLQDMWIEFCKAGMAKPGNLLTWIGPDETKPVVICFPTKVNWRDPSEYGYIDAGLSTLVDTLIENEAESVAIPALGCGLGGLEWDRVRELMEAHLSALDIPVTIFVPEVPNFASLKPTLPAGVKLIDY